MSGRSPRLCITARAALLLFALCLTGCTTAAPPAPVYRVVPSSTVKSVDWYFDATASLQGFVSPRAAGASYIQFVKTLEESLDSLYLQQAVFHTYKFGTASRPFTDLKESFRPDFYSASEGYKDTDLEVAGRALNPNGMTIIITDLFQSDNHIEAFRAALLKQGLGKRFQFGVLAVSAGFQGTLYDIPPLGTSMPYQGPHPVYAILLGPQEQVRALIADVLHRGTTEMGANIVQGALLSSQLATPKMALHDMGDRESDSNHLTLTELNAARDNERQILQEGDVPPPFAVALDLPHVATHPQVSFQSDLQFEPFAVLPSNPASADSWRLDTHVHVCSPRETSLLDRIRHAFASRHSAGSPPGANSGAEHPDVPDTPEDPCPVSDEELLTVPPTVQIRPIARGMQAAISVDLGDNKDRKNPFKARPGHIYAVELRLVPNGQDYVFPAWVTSFSQPSSARFSGLRTPNLVGFLTNMNQSIAQAKAPAALDDYLYIQSN